MTRPSGRRRGGGRSAPSRSRASARPLGREAFKFVDWLAAADQTWWQVLPLGPPDRYGSPYKARSAFAASPALLASPKTPVSQSERIDFYERNSWWIADWERFAGRTAV